MRIHAATLANMRSALLAPDKSLPSFDRVSIADRGKLTAFVVFSTS
jgi:hypothetical protein